MASADTAEIDDGWSLEEETSGVRLRPAAMAPLDLEALAAELVDVVRVQRAARAREAELRRALAAGLEEAGRARVAVPGGFIVAMPSRTRAEGDVLEIVAAGGLRVVLRDEAPGLRGGA